MPSLLFTLVLNAMAAVAALYQLVAIIAALAFKDQASRTAEAAAKAKEAAAKATAVASNLESAQYGREELPPEPPLRVSILKPVHGIEPSMRKAIASHTELEGHDFT